MRSLHALVGSPSPGSKILGQRLVARLIRPCRLCEQQLCKRQRLLIAATEASSTLTDQSLNEGRTAHASLIVIKQRHRLHKEGCIITPLQ